MNNNRMGTLVAVLVLGIVLGAGGAYLWSSTPGFPASSPQKPKLHAKEDGEHEDEHEAHEDHDEHAPQHEEEVVKLSSEALEEFDVEIRGATGGEIVEVLSLPGEIVLNADRVAHIVPRVAGIVKQVHKQLGDEVSPGEVMAVLESRELAEAKAAYLAGRQRLALSEATLASSEGLRTKGILPELEFLAIRKERDEAGIAVRAAEHRLRAPGLTKEAIDRIPTESDEVFSIYELRAPFTGTVIEKHITLGEAVNQTTTVFVLADLSTVWVNLTVYQKDMTAVRQGQPVVVSCGHGVPEVAGTIEYVSPVVEEATRTGTARIVLANPGRHWRPGLFVTGRLRASTMKVDVAVPKTALQTVDGQPTLFVETDGGFVLRPVAVGRSDDANVEITAGLEPGERFVTAGAFALKSELAKAGFEAGHAH